MSSAIRSSLFFGILLALSGLMVSSAQSANSAKRLETKIVQLQQKYQQLRSLEFDFSQATQTGGRIKQGSGNAVFFRPAGSSSQAGRGIMRWNYVEPMPQTIINDGMELSIYTPQDKQLIISPAQDMESDITYAIFTGTRSLPETFDILLPDQLFLLNPPPSGFEAVLLTPREPHPQVKRVQLWIDGDLTIHRLLMEDHFGALTELTFTRIRFNSLHGNGQQMQSLLKLDLAPGTETIRQ